MSRYTVFQKKILSWYEAHGRTHLPWRKNITPYRVLVSEIMLQQTQVDRVIPKFTAFIKAFPTVKALADAEQKDVLSLWQGLGYNRRALALKRAACEIVALHKGKLPKEVAELEALSGIGPYTARAVRTFAYNKPEAFIETNIRSVYIHHFFKGKEKVSDHDLMEKIEKSVYTENPRVWYWALMDYGSSLKKSEKGINAKSAAYKKQKPFKGSLREVRGALLREATKGPVPFKNIYTLPFEKEKLDKAVEALQKEGFIEKKKGYIILL